MADLTPYDQALILMSGVGIILAVSGVTAIWFMFAPREGDPGAIERD